MLQFSGLCSFNQSLGVTCHECALSLSFGVLTSVVKDQLARGGSCKFVSESDSWFVLVLFIGPVKHPGSQSLIGFSEFISMAVLLIGLHVCWRVFVNVCGHVLHALFNSKGGHCTLFNRKLTKLGILAAFVQYCCKIFAFSQGVRMWPFLLEIISSPSQRILDPLSGWFWNILVWSHSEGHNKLSEVYSNFPPFFCRAGNQSKQCLRRYSRRLHCRPCGDRLRSSLWNW